MSKIDRQKRRHARLRRRYMRTVYVEPTVRHAASCLPSSINPLPLALSPPSTRPAVLIASHNGALNLGETVRSAACQADVYVVSDGSTDSTAAMATKAGATVLVLEQNVGKPGALKSAIDYFGLTARYPAIAILDDDTVIAPDFMAESLKAMSSGVAIAVGKTITRWGADRRWNVWLGLRAYAYWRYQLFYRKAQSWLSVMNCISGSNSVYRSSLLKQVMIERTPYIVDDTFWVLETHRRRLGRVVYVPQAKAWLCDPTNLRDWYRQNLRWLWGSFQGIWGHEVGRHATRFDFFYLGLMFDWIMYVFITPFLLAGLLMTHRLHQPQLLLLIAMFAIMPCAAAVALKRWRLIPMVPFFILADWLYRVVFVHAIVKTVRQPRVESCRWQSPARYSMAEGR